MAFPADLSNVVVFKIHPAIGIARVSKSNDSYVFGAAPEKYKADKLIKRQDVRFRVFAYGDNHTGLGELTRGVMKQLGITSVWSARVGNRKIARLRKTPLNGREHVIAAEASSNDAKQGHLIGSLQDFAEGKEIPLGQITSDGIFHAPPGGAFRKEAGSQIPPYPAESDVIADTTCDGSVSVALTRNGAPLAIDVLPACIIVAPQDFSPDTNEETSMLDFFKRKLGIDPSMPPGNLHNRTARELDEQALRSTTEDFAPGFEACFVDERTEVIDVKSVFYHSTDDPRVDPREVRVRYKALNAPGNGAVPGQLTSGLCSPWQGDFTDCVGYWAEHLPDTAFLDENKSAEVFLFRKKYDDHTEEAEQISREHGDEFEKHVDKVGVVRLRQGKRVETERDSGDDITD